MLSTIRRVFAGWARGWPGLLVTLSLLAFSGTALAEPGDDGRPTEDAAPTAADMADAPTAPATVPGAHSPPAHDSPASDNPLTGSAPPSATGEVQAQATPAARRPRTFTYGANFFTTIESEPGSTSVVMAPLLEAAYALHPRILIDLAWGFGWLADNEGLGDSILRTGNPQLSGYFRGERGPWQYRAGLGVTAPLAHIPLGLDGRLYASLYNEAMAMSGMWNLWLWSPDRMAVPVTGNLTATLSNGDMFVLEAAFAPAIGVQNGVVVTELLGQVAVEARLVLDEIVTVCPRWQTVILPSTSFDRWQSSVGLRATFNTEAGRIFAGVLVNLDQPLGIFGGLGRWGFQLGKEIDL